MTVESVLTVVLVDDHPLYHAGLRQLLEADGIEVVGEASSAGDGIDLVERCVPDVAIVDPALPGGAELDAIRRMTGGGRRTRVLALASPSPEEDVVDVVLSGCSCYLLKEAPAETDEANAQIGQQHARAEVGEERPEHFNRRGKQHARPDVKPRQQLPDGDAEGEGNHLPHPDTPPPLPARFSARLPDSDITHTCSPI